jgi:hypothetical protein
LPGGLRSLAELYGVFGLLNSEAAHP